MKIVQWLRLKQREKLYYIECAIGIIFKPIFIIKKGLFQMKQPFLMVLYKLE